MMRKIATVAALVGAVTAQVSARTEWVMTVA